MHPVRHFAAALLALLAAAPAFANELSNGRITVDFDLSGSDTADRVDSIAWTNSDGTSTGNLATAGGPVNCGDAQEFFGQAYGDSDGGTMLMVVDGASAKWNSKNAASGTSKVSGRDECFTLMGKTTTAYSLSSKSSQESMLAIKRSFAFSDAAASQTDNLRAYAPRFNMNVYSSVIYPDSTGALHVLPIGNCPFAGAQGCEIADWNGRWVADDDGAGNGIALIRDKSSTAPAKIAADYDSFSASNVTSILLVKPDAGWSGKLVETEYLCFYDAKSWTAKNRAKGKLPDGCQVK
jgi:hypothetical protein